MTALELAESSYDRRAWGEAFSHLMAADAVEPLEAAWLERLAVAAHALGKDEESVAAWTRAFTARIEAGEHEAAALAAGWCSFGLLTRGEVVLGSGWLERATALCADHRLDCAAVGFVKAQAAAGLMLGGNPEAGLPIFEEAGRWAERFGDANTLALSRLGRAQCLVRLGRTTEGITQFDQLLVALVTDELSPLVAGLAFCAAIDASQRCLDVRRAQAWTAALSRWCDEQPDLVPYRGNCLVHRAEILALHGAWQEALVEAERARDWLTSVVADRAVGSAYYRVGEMYRLRGDYDAAEQAYQSASRKGHEPQPGFGLLRLAQGHANSAAAAIRRALEEAVMPLDRAHLLVAQVEIALSVDDVETARGAEAELNAIADETDAPLLRAQALHVQGAVRLAGGDARGGLTSLREAWKTWQDLEAPYDGARARMLIGQACRALGDEDTAEMEFDAARWVFQELGARPDLAEVQKLSKRSAGASPGGLSLREVQVLRLVAAGKSNRAIADELFLSEKTVHRHLSNIFTKLDVSSRSAATAYAFQHDLV